MTRKERMDAPDVPTWWLEKVLPLLDSPAVDPAEVARHASIHAQRQSPWTANSISKFKSGTGRTVALVNGISSALQIPQPFFTAPTEAAAVEMAQIVRSAKPQAKPQLDAPVEKLAVVDGVAAREIRAAKVDADRKRTVGSTNHAEKSGSGERNGRAGRGRS
jgi:hypothetical protein